MSRTTQLLTSFLTLLATAALLSAAEPAESAGRWSVERANQWFHQQPWLVGCNFSPSTAINQLEMWQADTFDAATIDRELGWAAGIGMNTVRVFLHDQLWQQDRKGFLERMERFLVIADKQGIRPMFVLFDNCWDPHPKLGKQPAPRPHVHNSGWVQSPDIETLRDVAKHDQLAGYVTGVIKHFKDDRRILAWDLYNEPGNDGSRDKMTTAEKEEKSLALLRKTFGWARKVAPTQPLTVGVWIKEWSGPNVTPLNRFMLENADMISFHAYDRLDQVRKKVESLRPLGRPLLCTEYMARTAGSTFEDELPYFKTNQIAAYNWGFVAGKTQTQYPWSSWKKQFTAEPEVWHHDIFRPDGTPFNPKEVALIKSLTARPEVGGKKTNLTVGFVWPSVIPDDCPFPRSPTLTGIYFTGRHSDYKCGDTWYPSWASDGNLYSPWTDGETDGVKCGSGDRPKHGASTGHAVMIGDDPLRLIITNTSPPKEAWAKPYRGRYPAGSLVHNGIWYYGTYCLGPSGGLQHRGFKWNWPNLGPMPGFQISRDLGKTWEASPLSPEKPLFPEPAKYLGPVKMGAPHFVDFGKNMEHSPDGKVYLLGMGAETDDPQPRPCVKPGQPGTAFELNPGCTNDFAHANLSWISADQVYLARVKPSPETINDIKAYEFFAGHDAAGKPVWTSDFAKIRPLLDWNNHMGCVTATYVPGLKKYLMCVTDGWPTVAKMDSYILEADDITGPWRIVTYLKDFGEQAYFLNFPSKFISADGKGLWLCYSANFSPGWNGVDLKFNPPGGRYGLCLHELQLLGPGANANLSVPQPAPPVPSKP